MAEHYAVNAQHELVRLAVSQPFSARIAHVRRLHADYSALAATAQLPNDSDFDFEESESAEEFESERMSSVHPDRLALMSSGPEDIAPSASQTRVGSPVHVSTNSNNSVMPRNVRNRRRSRESSVESIDREDGFDFRVHDHHNHVDRNQWMQEYATPLHHNQLAAPFFPLQALTEFLQPPWPYGGNTYCYAPTITVVNNYYGFTSPQQLQYEFGGDDQNGFSDGSHVSRGRRGRGRCRGHGRHAH
ncbi:hypothetical protein KCU73_g7097, partial [Aureobasidium melanogenum]